jgi:hypothetical protein
MTRAGTLVLATVLAACAETQWTRPDFSPAQAVQDETACQEQAEREASLRPSGLYGSLSRYYGPNVQPYGRTRWISAPGPLFDVDPMPRLLEQMRIEDQCMRAKGYERRPTS